jgi:putative ABC transport system ATP-binding protein
LADEPTGNLDPSNKNLILDLIYQQAEENNQTLVVVTHDMGILSGFDRTIDFEQFRVANESSVDSISVANSGEGSR